jgi:hypothetical protein
MSNNLCGQLGAGTSAPEVISLQKADSLLAFECTEKLKRFLRRNDGGIWIKIHLNPTIRILYLLLNVLAHLER